MSSALKPALTPSGVQNQPVPSQLNKPIHTQGAPTTYGQPMSHIPQNLVNIPHNAPNSGSVHNQVHSINSNVHPPNHYSLNVPNAAQHYPISGNIPNSTHSAPVSNHPIPNTTQAHVQPPPTFSPSPKNLSYNPNYQPTVAHSYKPTPVPTSQPSEIALVTEKPQSNGTPEIKIATKPESSQNHITPVTTTQLPPSEIQPPSVPENAKMEQSPIEPEKSVKEQDESKPSDGDGKGESIGPAVEDVGEAMVAATADSVPSSADDSSAISSESIPEADLPADSTSADVMETDRPPSPPPLQSTEVPEQIKDAVDDNSASPTNATVSKTKDQNNQKPTLKLATTPRIVTKKPKVSKQEPETPKVFKPETKVSQKSPGSGGKSKRTRTKTQPYQSPLPEVEMISKISATIPRSKNIEDKLIIFYKNEFLAVRNSEGGFYICQAVQNIYKSSPKIRIRWLSQDKGDKEVYSPDFYDNTDFDCILTNLNLARAGKGKYKLPAAERIRTDSILKRALAVEKGDEKPSLTEEHPDGLDLSLYKEESQLKKRKAVKRKAISPLRAASSSGSTIKFPTEMKVQKIAPKPKPPPVKKAIVLKKALATKVKKVIPPPKPTRIDRPLKRQPEEIKLPIKTVPMIDQKKAKVLAKVARKVAIPIPKTQPPPPPPPPKQNAKSAKAAVPQPPPKKPVAKKPPPVAITRKSKRAKK